MYTYIHMPTYAYIQHLYIHTCKNTRILAYMHTYIHRQTNKQTYIHTYIHVDINSPNKAVHLFSCSCMILA